MSLHRVDESHPPTLSTGSPGKGFEKSELGSEVNITIKCRYEVLTPAMSASHISIPTWGKAVSWNRNGLVQ